MATQTRVVASAGRTRLLRSSLAATLALLVTACVATGPVPPDVVALALAQDRLAPTPTLAPDRLARLDRALQRYVDEDRVAGVVALVLHDGKPVYDKAFGWRDREARQPMTTDTIFRIASQTKAITSAAILALVEEGRIGLDQPVSEWIPDFAKSMVSTRSGAGAPTLEPARRPITIRHLLTHTAGLSYGVSADVAPAYAAAGFGPAAGFGWYLADRDEPTCASMSRLGALPLVAQPGEAFVYGYGTDVLGCIVEKVSGLSLDEFLRQRFIAPLGMTDTAFFLPPESRVRLAAVYLAGPDGRVVRAPPGPKGQGDYVEGPRRHFSGGAGLMSTARDYARFLEAIRNGGVLDGARILAPRTVQLMRTNQIGSLHWMPGRGFGLGFETTERYGARDLEAVGGYGWAGAYGTVYRIDPQARLTMLLMIQQLPVTTDLGTVFPTLVYQALDDR